MKKLRVSPFSDMSFDRADSSRRGFGSRFLFRFWELRFFKRIVGKLPGSMKQGERSVGMPVDPDGRPDVMEPVPVGRDLKGPSFERHAVVVANGPVVLLAEDLV